VEILLWFLFEVMFSGALEFLFELNDAFNKSRELRSAALVWFIILGVIGGAITGFLAPRPVLSAGPFPGVSLLILPIFLAIMMNAWGYLRAERDKTVSHLATWYGGATLGVGLAAGRLLVLAFTGEMKM